MNAALSEIAQREGAASRYMPDPPTAHHDHGGGNVEAVPLVNFDFLMKCGVEALYLVTEELDAPERHTVETKEALARLIIDTTCGKQPAATTE